LAVVAFGFAVDYLTEEDIRRRQLRVRNAKRKIHAEELRLNLLARQTGKAATEGVAAVPTSSTRAIHDLPGSCSCGA
jgi:hypothetical protein